MGARLRKLFTFFNQESFWYWTQQDYFISGSEKGFSGCNFAGDEIENTPKLVLTVPNSPISLPARSWSLCIVCFCMIRLTTNLISYQVSPYYPQLNGNLRANIIVGCKQVEFYVKEREEERKKSCRFAYRQPKRENNHSARGRQQLAPRRQQAHTRARSLPRGLVIAHALRATAMLMVNMTIEVGQRYMSLGCFHSHNQCLDP